MKKTATTILVAVVLIISCKKHSQQQTILQPTSPAPKAFQELLSRDFYSQIVIDSSREISIDSSKYVSYYLNFNFLNAGYSGIFLLTKSRYNSIIGAKNGECILMGNNNDSVMLINAPFISANQVDLTRAYDTSYMIFRSVNDTILNNTYKIKNFTALLKINFSGQKETSIITFK